MQTQECEQAYAAGLARGRAIMAGQVGSTRRHGPAGQYYLDRAREAAEAIGWPEEVLLSKVTAFHAERLDSVPDLTLYPELRGQRDILLERYRGMADGGISEELIAIVESMDFWRDYRLPVEAGKSFYRLATERKLRERCRVVYVPESDQGQLHAKNIDDPLATWTPGPIDTSPGPWPHGPLFFDGVGSGLHIDEVPPEVFPVDAIAMAGKHCGTVEETREFLVRYNYFWGGGNLLVHDYEGNSVAFEKSSRCRIATRGPDRKGINYITGMGAFDPEMAAFVDQQREIYLRETEQPDDSLEATYWRFCKGQFRNMARYMKELAQEPTADKLTDVMCARDSDGPLCKGGVPCHPDDVLREATLMQRLYFLDQKRQLVRQWADDKPVWESEWTEVRYT